MNTEYCGFTAEYCRIGEFLHGVDTILYIPEKRRSSTGIVVMHSDGNYLSFSAGPELAKRGFLTLCANVADPSAPLEKKLPSVKTAIEVLRARPEVKRIVLLGHSGGATLMSCYQAVAENGPEIFRDARRIVPMGEVPELPAADALMLIDSNFGNGVMTLVSIDPAVTDETCGTQTDPAFFPFTEEHGFHKNGETCYTETFKKRFFAAQAERQGRLIQSALERYEALQAHRGKFADDEPLIIPGGSQIAPNNRLFPHDLHLLAHTKEAYDLIHGRDGSVTREVIRSRRTARGDLYGTPILGLGGMITTVKTYLSSNCVRTLPDYAVREDGISGIEYDSSFCCTPGNVKYIRCPLLIMGMSGGYECIASEVIAQNAVSADKTVAFVEGGTHMIGTATDAEAWPGEFGDAPKTLYDHIAKWLLSKCEA